MSASIYKRLLVLVLMVLLAGCSVKVDNLSQDQEQEIVAESPFVIIPLGSDCFLSFTMKEYNLRLCAFPFDWWLTPYGALYDLIKNDFKDHFKRENLVPSLKSFFTEQQQSFLNKSGRAPVCESPFWVLDKQSGVFYLHDFPNNAAATINEHYEVLYAKYMRRIDRFYRTMQSGKHVYLIRYLDMNKTEAHELCKLLEDKFPTTAFTLIVIGYDLDEFGQDWNIPHIKNVYIQKGCEDHNVFCKKLYGDIMSGALR